MKKISQHVDSFQRMRWIRNHENRSVSDWVEESHFEISIQLGRFQPIRRNELAGLGVAKSLEAALV
jgi:hypothetical protein